MKYAWLNGCIAAAVVLVAIAAGASTGSAGDVVSGAACPPVVIHVLDGDGNPAETVELMFNPKEYSIEKSVPWKKRKRKKKVPVIVFEPDVPNELSVDFVFDDPGETGSFEDVIAPLRDLTIVRPKAGTPPPLRFMWGEGLDFTGFLSGLNVEYTLFLPNGRPVRAKVQMRFTEFSPPEEQRQRTRFH